MSIRVSAFAYAQEIDWPEKWLLVCLSDMADDWGDSIFPALETLERKTSMPRSTLKRTFKKLLATGIVVMTARATPISPAFYRIVLPDPGDTARPPKDPQCHPALRRAVLYAFNGRCECCGRHGLFEIGPDGRPWQVERLLPGKAGGMYVPENVTLACRSCSTKKDKPKIRLRSLTERQQEPPDEGGRVQSDPSPGLFELSIESVPLQRLDSGGGFNLNPGGGSNLDPGRVQSGPRGGSNLDPDPSIDPSLIRQKRRSGFSSFFDRYEH